MKEGAETPAAKKRKSEWHAALKKLPGDTSMAKAGIKVIALLFGHSFIHACIQTYI